MALSAYAQGYYRTPAKQREYALRHKYGLEPGDFEHMLDLQGYRCAVCQTDEPGGRHGRFVVDHDHETGEVRGLLCSHCNVSLGWVEKVGARSITGYLNRKKAV